MKTLNELAKEEIEMVLNLADDKGNVTKNGIFVKNELVKLGWVVKSYKQYSNFKIFSDVYYDCGYSGSYNFSRMVKGQ